MSFVTGWNGQPRSDGAESRIRRVVPLHRSAFTVAPFFYWPAQLADRIFYFFPGFGVVVLHTQFFAVIHDGCSAKGEVKAGHQFGDLVIVLSVAISIIGTDDIVVADDIDGPTT